MISRLLSERSNGNLHCSISTICFTLPAICCERILPFVPRSQNRYQHILVDEFQDTDPLQSEILFLLCGEDGADKPWHEQQLRPGQLFLVGDPKQSVYRFRRADIRSYKEAKAAIQRQWPENVLPSQITSARGDRFSILSINALLFH